MLTQIDSILINWNDSWLDERTTESKKIEQLHFTSSSIAAKMNLRKEHVVNLTGEISQSMQSFGLRYC